jgi:hypothetical protein
LLFIIKRNTPIFSPNSLSIKLMMYLARIFNQIHQFSLTSFPLYFGTKGVTTKKYNILLRKKKLFLFLKTLYLRPSFWSRYLPCSQTPHYQRLLPLCLDLWKVMEWDGVGYKHISLFVFVKKMNGMEYGETHFIQYHSFFQYFIPLNLGCIQWNGIH